MFVKLHILAGECGTGVLPEAQETLDAIITIMIINSLNQVAFLLLI